MIFNFKKAKMVSFVSMCLLMNFQTVLAGEFNEFVSCKSKLNRKYKDYFDRKLNCMHGKIQTISITDHQNIDDMGNSFVAAFFPEEQSQENISTLSTEIKNDIVTMMKKNTNNKIYAIRTLDNKKIASFAILETKIDEVGTPYYYVYLFWTKKEFERQGYGFDLLSYLIKKSHNDNLRLQLAYTDEGLSLYTKLLNKEYRKYKGCFVSLPNDDRFHKRIKFKRSNSCGLMSNPRIK